MAESGAHSSAEYDQSLSAFLQVGNWSIADDCIVPLASLPSHYRDEIDKGFSTGWRTLDRYMQGLRRGEVTVITADTGAGKTTFASQVMVNAAMQGVPGWVNSWEMRPETTMRKLASIILRKPMKLQNFTPEDSVAFDTWAQQYRLYINPNTMGTDMVGLTKQLKKAKELGIELVMLDHLDYLVNSRTEKLHEAIDQAVKRLHELAFALQMHFLLICHPRQTAASNEEVGIHSLKGSSSIKQYADNVLVLHRCARTDPSCDPTKVKIRIAKNRMFGTEGNAYLFYQPLWDGYVELHESSKGEKDVA